MNRLTNFNLVPIPQWIYKAAINSNISINEFNSYDTMRKLLSLNDLGDWYHLHDVFGELDFSPLSLYSSFVDFSAEARMELRSISSNTDKNALISRLSYSNSMIYETYQILTSMDNVYVVVADGFLTHILDASNKLTFVKECLKALYVVMDEQDVNNTLLFNTYVKMLYKTKLINLTA